MKRFACHITAHTAVEAILDLRGENKFSGSDVAAVQIAGSRRMATVNNIPAPADIMIAQFSVPFCVALALYRNPVDPYSFDEASPRDPAIKQMAARVNISAVPGQDDDDISSTVTVTNEQWPRVLLRRVTQFSRNTRASSHRRGHAREVYAARAKISRGANGTHVRED